MASLLIIDDDAPQRRVLRDALEEAALFERILEAGDGIRGLKLLVSESIDMVICDLEMPGLQGDKLIRMSSSAVERAVPFLMLTGITDAKRHAKLFRQGARDVITKPFHPLDVIARIQLHLELIRLQDELVQKNRLLEQLSITDPLTGLPNRRHLDAALEREFQRAQRQQIPFCALMFDIDHFKHVNDTWGHSAGDAVIRSVGETLSAFIRLTDSGGRFGGEEFLVLTGSPLDGAEILAERVRGAIEAKTVTTDEGHEIQVTVSAGVASFDGDMTNPESVVARADEALYDAKSRGRNQVVVAPGPGHASKKAEAASAASPT